MHQVQAKGKEKQKEKKAKKGPHSSQIPGGWTLQRMTGSQADPPRSSKTKPRIQRTLQVDNPGVIPPHLASGTITTADQALIPANLHNKTSAQIVTTLLGELCPGSSWSVSDEGVVSPANDGFCGDSGAEIRNRASVSCDCICDTIAAGRTYRIIIAEEHDGNITADSGQGFFLPPTSTTADGVMVMTGRRHDGITGYGATAPESSTAPSTTAPTGAQTLADPPWLILGHELCGHGGLYRDPAVINDGNTPFPLHEVTQEGDQSAVDIENAIRAEHSTTTNNMGQRVDMFTGYDKEKVSEVPGSDFNFYSYWGATYIVQRGDNIWDLCRKFGLPFRFIEPDHMADPYLRHRRPGTPNRRRNRQVMDNFFRPIDLQGSEMYGDFILRSEADLIHTGETLFIEKITWHNALAGQTVADIAALYGKAASSLIRANRSLNRSSQTLSGGERILIPAS